MGIYSHQHFEDNYSKYISTWSEQWFRIEVWSNLIDILKYIFWKENIAILQFYCILNLNLESEKKYHAISEPNCFVKWGPWQVTGRLIHPQLLVPWKPTQIQISIRGDNL